MIILVQQVQLYNVLLVFHTMTMTAIEKVLDNVLFYYCFLFIYLYSTEKVLLRTDAIKYKKSDAAI